jgi:hypothetical protein
MAPSQTHIAAWEQDPGLGAQPDGGILIHRPVPDQPPTLKITISQWIFDQQPGIQPPPPALYNTGTAEFRYWAAVEALTRGATFWNTQLPELTWQTGERLPVILDAGKGLNAGYDREGLSFLMGVIGSRNVHLGESPDVLCHEQGHAVLDAVKPELFDVAYIETSAFHESFADCSSILCALQLPSLRTGILNDTGNRLSQSSRLSALAEQMGWAIRQKDPADTEADCFRNAVNAFIYKDPNTLPDNGPATELTSGAHSFSRVFTGAFFEALAGMFSVRPAQDEQNLLQASVDMAQILIAAVTLAPVVPAFYSQVATHMIGEAANKFGSLGYAAALERAFMDRDIIGTTPTPVSAVSTHRISTAEYGLGTDSILVHIAPPHHVAAKSFLEDLLRTDCLKMPDNAPAKLKTSNKRSSDVPGGYEPFTHELKKQGEDFILKRIRFNCGHVPKFIP